MSQLTIGQGRNAGATRGLSRRSALKGGLAGAFGLAVAATPGIAAGVASPGRILIRNATIASADKTIGNLLQGDILIEGERILAIGPSLDAGGAQEIDASNMIAMPGMIDTHRHMWQGAIRRAFPDATLDEYFDSVLTALGPHYRPDDVHIGNLVSAFSAIDAGITSILDWSHIQNTPDHTDAAIAALQASGIRAVFGYGAPQIGYSSLEDNKDHRYPQDIRRLRSQYFASDDQLLTLAIAADGPSYGPAEPAILEWRAAREVDARISVHIMGPQTLDNLKIMHEQGLLKDDTTYVHCTNLPPEAWQLIRDTGGTVSISSTVEMQMGHGIPVTQTALDYGIRPSLSVDVETSAPTDMFTQMRSVLALQRGFVHQRQAAEESEVPPLITVADVFEFATIEGARANGTDARTGSLTPGKQADIILLRQDTINVIPSPQDDPVASVVLGMDTSNIDSVFVAGKALKRDGKLVGADLGALSTRARASHDYLMEQRASAGADAPQG